VGLFFEQLGYPRMAGRILGWLLICEPPLQSIEELAQTLHASKGSLSTMSRLLIQVGLVERTSLPGERRDFFRLKPGAWRRLITVQLQVMTELHQVVERGLALVDDDIPADYHRLREAHDLYAFLERELPALLRRWDEERVA
jgi:DNA-binding transcriptional regulator GbsR (MarR family)